MKELSGSCLCGKVNISIQDDFEYLANCHCSECQKFSGSDYASVGGLSSAKFKITSGDDYITYFSKTEETDVAFCSVCGSSLFSRKKTGQKHNIRLGVLDDTPSNRPSVHIYTSAKAGWHTICDDLPQFETTP